jgi:hypothetical protein
MNQKDREMPTGEVILTVSCLIFVVSGFLFVTISVISEALSPPKMILKELVPEGGWSGVWNRHDKCAYLCPLLPYNYPDYPFVDSEYDNETQTCKCYIAKTNISGFTYVQIEKTAEMADSFSPDLSLYLNMTQP